MTMPNPVFDERSFDDLVREGLALLPVHAPEWTDHNPSDPGVTLVELLAYFSDMLLYRTGRVTPAARLQFLRLLKGASWRGWRGFDTTDPDALHHAIDNAVAELAHVDCAVTASDFERLAWAAAERRASVGRGLIVRCIVDADLSGGRQRVAEVQRAGHVSVIVAAIDEISAEDAARLRTDVRRYLLPRCLMTTRLHVVAPDDLYVGIGFGVALRPGASLQAVKERIGTALQSRFETGAGESGLVPALGVALNLAEVARVIDDVEGVDYVEDVTILQLSASRHTASHADAGVGIQVGRRSTIGVDTRIGVALHGDENAERLVRDSEGILTSIRLKPWERLHLSIAHDGMREIGVLAHGIADPGGPSGRSQ